MSNTYKYYKINGKIFRIHVEYDQYPENRREIDGFHVSHMMCWHRRYFIGDYKENKWDTPNDMLNDLVNENVPESTIINYVKNGNTKNKLKLSYDRHDKTWTIYGIPYSSESQELKEIESDIMPEFLTETIIEVMTFDDKWKLLKNKGFEMLPIYMYDHGGISVSTSDYGDPFDSGQIGWIYTTKDEILKSKVSYRNSKGKFVKCNTRNWRECALWNMQLDVKEYDQYLNGEVFCGIVEEWKPKSKRWKTIECLGDYYSDKCADDLIREIMSDMCVDVELKDTFAEVCA